MIESAAFPWVGWLEIKKSLLFAHRVLSSRGVTRRAEKVKGRVLLVSLSKASLLHRTEEACFLGVRLALMNSEPTSSFHIG